MLSLDIFMVKLPAVFHYILPTVHSLAQIKSKF